MPSRGRTLQEIAKEAGFQSAESLANAVGVDKSTINRVWQEARWYHSVNGRTIAGIVSVVPQATDALEVLVLASTRQEVIESLARKGISLDEEALGDALEDPGIESQYLNRALTAASHIMNSDIAGATDCLGTLWGRPQTRALDLVFSREPRYELLKEPGKLMEAAEDVLEKIVEGRYSTQARAVAQVHLAHHIGKAGGTVNTTAIPASHGPVAKQRNVFIKRAATMGHLRSAEATPDDVEEYATKVSQYGHQQRIELWAFPSWLRDITGHSEFDLPPEVHLANTATEVIHEINTYNDSYVLYLCRVFIPLALSDLDPHFGQKIPQLRKALEVRAEKTELSELEDAAKTLVRQLALAT